MNHHSCLTFWSTLRKGASEKRRLTQYVTNTVLDDNYKGITEQLEVVKTPPRKWRQLNQTSSYEGDLDSTTD